MTLYNVSAVHVIPTSSIVRNFHDLYGEAWQLDLLPSPIAHNVHGPSVLIDRLPRCQVRRGQGMFSVKILSFVEPVEASEAFAVLAAEGLLPVNLTTLTALGGLERGRYRLLALGLRYKDLAGVPHAVFLDGWRLDIARVDRLIPTQYVFPGIVVPS